MKTRSDNEQQLTEYVPANIKHLREGRKLTQVELSKQLLAKHPKCGLTSKRISDIEIKRNPIYIQELIAYAAFFDCTIDVLFEKPASMEYVALNMDDLENRVHATELAQIKLKARVDFIVEAINTLQGTADAPKELFQ
jgi:transcriptional regulator with XRE-family HTH domain